MKHITGIKNNSHCGIFVLWLIVFTFLLNGYSSAENLSDGVGVISREKIRVEEAAKILIKNEKRSSANYKVGKFYYTDARGAINGWIDSVIFVLKSDKGSEEIDNKINILSSAVDKSNRLVEFIYKNKPSELSSKKSSEILPSIVGALEFIWKEYLTGENDRRKRLIKDLEGLKVVSFEELEIHK
jgi:hypothetical protein